MRQRNRTLRFSQKRIWRAHCALMKMKVLRTDTDERRAVAAELPQGRVFASGKAFVPFVAAPVYQRLIGLAAAADSICPEGAGGGRGGQINESLAAPESNRPLSGQHEGGGLAPLGVVRPAPAAGADSNGPVWAGWGLGGAKNESAAAPESNRGHFGGPLGAGAVLAGAGPADPPETAQPQAGEPLGHLTLGSLVLASVGSAEGWWESVIVEISGDLLRLKWEAWPDEPTFVRRTSQIALLHPSHP
jgi:hypothetical protein